MKKVFRLLVIICLLYACNDTPATTETAPANTASDASTTPKDVDLGDDKYTTIAKEGMGHLASGNVDAWMAQFADNAQYRWNNLDSVVGKQAITEYWKKRRADVIDTLLYTNNVWLSLKVNKPLVPTQRVGNYALLWNTVNAKYKTGKSMTQRMHLIFHFDANDKIDVVSHYLDFVPVLAATK